MNKTLRNGAWAVASVFFGKFFPIGASLLLVRLFDVHEYGDYALSLATINLCLTATGLGLVGGLVVRISAQSSTSDNAEMARQVAAFQILSNTLLFILLFCTLCAVGLGLFDSRMVDLLRDRWYLVILLVMVQISLAAQSAVATVTNQLKRFALFSLVSGVIVAILQICCAIKWGVDGALMGMSLGYFAQYLFQRRLLKEITCRSSRFRFADVRGAYTAFVSYGKYLFGSSLLVAIGMWWLSYSLLKGTGGMQDVATFNVLNHWKMVLMFLPLAATNFISSRFAVGDRANPASAILMLKKTLLMGGALLTLLTLGAIVFREEILQIYGKSYAHIGLELVLISIISLVAGINSIFGGYILAVERFRQGFFSNAIWFFSLVAFQLYILRFELGALGACVALMIAYFTHSAYQVWLYIAIRRASAEC